MSVDPPTSDDWESDAGHNFQVVRASARLRRNRRRNRRVTIVATVLTAAFAVGMFALVYAGWRSTLRVTGGRERKVTDPAAPGYTAEAAPTPVQLLAVTNGDGGLNSLLLFIEGNGDAPVTVVPISSSLTAWDYEEAGPMTLTDLFAEGGMDVLSLRLGVDLTFGVTSFAETPFSAFDPLLAQIGEISIELSDNVYGLDENGEKYVRYPAGALTLQPPEVAEFLSFSGFMELEVNRNLRAKSVWTQIFDRIASGDAALELPDAVDEGVPLLVGLRDSDAKAGRAVSNGDAGDGSEPRASRRYAIEFLPTKDIPLYVSPPVVLDRVDADSMPNWVTRFVPFPISAYPGQRWVVSLLNGTSDQGVIRAVAPRVVSAGGAIGLTGNADSFDTEKSIVEYSNDAAQVAAETVAAQFGVTPTRVELMPSGIDVTVVVGKDLLG